MSAVATAVPSIAIMACVGRQIGENDVTTTTLAVTVAVPPGTRPAVDTR
jgi:hypothetical protein